MGNTLLQLHPNVRLTPECDDLLEQAEGEIAIAPAKRLTPADLEANKALNRFKSHCSPLVKQAARDTAAIAAMDKGQINRLLGKMPCADKQRLHDEPSGKLGSSSEKERELMTSLASDIQKIAGKQPVSEGLKGLALC